MDIHLNGTYAEPFIQFNIKTFSEDKWLPSFFFLSLH